MELFYKLRINIFDQKFSMGNPSMFRSKFGPPETKHFGTLQKLNTSESSRN